MKLLFVGGSHLACLMESFAEKPAELAGVEADFVAVAGPDARHIFLDGDHVKVALDRVHPTERTRLTKLGKPDRDIREADAVFVFNTLFSVQPLIYGVLGRPHIAETYTWSYLDAVARGQTEASAAFQLAAEIRARSGKPTFLCHQPFKDRGDPKYRDVVVPESHRDFILEAVEASARGADLEVLRQPAETIVDSVFTDPQFSVGSVRLNGEKHGEDYTHMNTAFGRIWLRHAVDALERWDGGATTRHVRTADTEMLVS